ncbi:YbhB/YbcL family Raf kinase inhibitor-like protein [Dehalococcoides mccartyi]|nr:YbhB/YbcL family Raf kinase inhibitor-like protein [Dehalococcoides mccartyi]
MIFTVLLLSTVVILASCSSGDDTDSQFDPESSLIASIEFSSQAFEDGADIPVEFTCDGDNNSPSLRWSDVPGGTRSIAILMDDPDAPGRIFRHWSVFNIPSGTRSLAANQAKTSELKDSTRQAKNEFGSVGYSGPCPPAGETHEYVFFIYALSEPLELDTDASPLDVSAALRGKVVGTGSFSGMYARR